MDYELAKKLKDSGFPNYEEDWVDEVGHVVLHPTLSELIEACGDNFLSLDSSRIKDKTDKWTASGADIKDFFREGVGSTPEESVANLWLALQGKK